MAVVHTRVTRHEMPEGSPALTKRSPIRTSGDFRLNIVIPALLSEMGPHRPRHGIIATLLDLNGVSIFGPISSCRPAESPSSRSRRFGTTANWRTGEHKLQLMRFPHIRQKPGAAYGL